MAAKCPASITLQNKLVKAAATCTACAPQVEYLESIADACPEVAHQAAELRVFLETLQKLTTAGLQGTLDPSVQQSEG